MTLGLVTKVDKKNKAASKLKTELKNLKHSSYTIALSKELFLRRSWYLNVYFLKLYLCVYLHTKIQVSSIILTRFRQGVILSPPPHHHHFKQIPKNPPRLGLHEMPVQWFFTRTEKES